MDTDKDSSTYGSIFGFLLIISIIIFLSYISIQNLLEAKEKREELKDTQIVIKGIPENEVSEEGVETVRFENLSEAEAEELIKELLESGEKNEKEIKKLEGEL